MSGVLGAMKKHDLLPLQFLLSFIAFASASPLTEFVPGEILVWVEGSGFGDKQVEALLRLSSPVFLHSIEKMHDYELQPSTERHGPRLFTLKFDDKVSPALVSAIVSRNPLFTAEPNFIGYGNMQPDDPLLPAQWGLYRIEALEAFDIELGDDNIVISVIDTGVDLDHEDLAVKLLPGWDAVDNDFVPEDDHHHGTNMAGIAAAATNNGIGVAGACPNCKILPVRAGYNNGGNATFTSGRVLRALEYSVNNPRGLEGVPENPNPADVISMSFSFQNPSTFLEWGVGDAYSEGAFLAAAAGNYNNSTPRYPAAYPEVVAVAATDQEDARWNFSNYGEWVDIAAPGVSIMTTHLSDQYGSSTGTSPSAPFVAALAALMLSRTNVGLTQEELKQIIIETSDPVTGFPAIIGGRINALNALLATPFEQPQQPTTRSKLLYEQYGEGQGA